MTTKALLRSVRDLSSRVPKPRMEANLLSLHEIRKIKDHVCALALAAQAAGRLNNLVPWQQQMLDSYEKPPKRLRKPEIVRLFAPRLLSDRPAAPLRRAVTMRALR
jgi:hypothetical protein